MTQTLALLLTLIIETPLIIFLAKRWGVTWQRAALASLIASGVSHPVAWTFNWSTTVVFQTEYYLWWFISIEFLVILMEAGIFRMVLRFDWGRCLGLSFLANTLSAVIGLVLMM